MIFADNLEIKREGWGSINRFDISLDLDILSQY